ncbi:hypothetical protein AUK22_11515 [bacterium CG2_30_54_10]|nr:MAG: hypothetical protein AUK22_11515 [bacterium CG2_30_54_10]
MFSPIWIVSRPVDGVNRSRFAFKSVLILASHFHSAAFFVASAAFVAKISYLLNKAGGLPSFPRKRESGMRETTTEPWIPAMPGMTHSSF